MSLVICHRRVGAVVAAIVVGAACYGVGAVTNASGAPSSIQTCTTVKTGKIKLTTKTCKPGKQTSDTWTNQTVAGMNTATAVANQAAADAATLTQQIAADDQKAKADKAQYVALQKTDAAALAAQISSDQSMCNLWQTTNNYNPPLNCGSL
jgi:hypothetical protein